MVALRVQTGTGRRLITQVLVVATALAGLAVVEWSGDGFGFSDWHGYVVLYASICASPALAAPWRVLFVAMELSLALVLTVYGGVVLLFFQIGSLLPGLVAAWIAFLAMVLWEGRASILDR
jgi:hypothetical protein